MSSQILVVSEWLPKENQEEALFDSFKKLAKTTLEKEKECLKYHVTRQTAHPASKGESKYPILLVQEYVNVDAFNHHCTSEHVAAFTQSQFEQPEKSMIEDWRCRVFNI